VGLSSHAGVLFEGGRGGCKRWAVCAEDEEAHHFQHINAQRQFRVNSPGVAPPKPKPNGQRVRLVGVTNHTSKRSVVSRTKRTGRLPWVAQQSARARSQLGRPRVAMGRQADIQ